MEHKTMQPGNFTLYVHEEKEKNVSNSTTIETKSSGRSSRAHSVYNYCCSITKFVYNCL